MCFASYKCYFSNSNCDFFLYKIIFGHIQFIILIWNASWLVTTRTMKVSLKRHTCVLTLTTHTFVLFIKHFKFVIQIIVFLNSVTAYKYVEFLVSSHNQKLLLLKEIKRKIVPSSKKKKAWFVGCEPSPPPMAFPFR
jgi:hypothetical protein